MDTNTDKPDADSQFRLNKCPCGSHDVVYQCTARIGWDEYRVKCMNCGRRTPWHPCRHDAQNAWNEMVRRG